MTEQASGTGKLGTTPLVDVLVQLLDRQMTGTLVIEDHRYLKSGLSFERGVPRRARLPEPAHPLAEVLVSLGKLAEPVAQHTLRQAQAEQALHGQWLVAHRMIAPEALTEALAEQLARKIEWMARLRPESVFGFYPDTNYLDRYGGPEPVAPDPLALIWRVAKANLDPARVEALLRTLAGTTLRLHRAGRLTRFGFDRSEQAVTDVLRSKPMTVAEVLAAGLLDPERLARQLYVLAVTRHLDLGDATALPVAADAADSGRHSSVSSGSLAAGRSTPLPVSSAAGPPSPPPSRHSPVAAGPASPVSSPASAVPSSSAAPGSASPKAGTAAPTGIPASGAPAQVAAFKDEIAQRLQLLSEQTHYQVLGLERGVPTSAVQGAFFALAKRWHPDRLPADLAEAKADVTKLFARMSEAHQTLGNERKRAEYDAVLASGVNTKDEQDVVERALQASQNIQRAEILLKRGDPAGAARAAMEATEAEPNNHLYRAIYADVLSQTPARASGGNYGDLLEWLEAARKAEPNNPRIRLARARVLKRSGDAEGAYKEYHKVLQLAPHDVEAKQEIRLHKTRQAGGRSMPPRGSMAPSPASGESGRLLGKLFKR